ncbi:CW-type Zinc Finger [Trichuris suis]|nr:CW-type Zinc Finger [Trichuris suis]
MFYRTSVDMCRSALSRRLRPTSERLQRRTVRQKTFGRRFRQRRPDALVEIKDGKDGVVKRCSNVACRDVYPVCVAEASYRCSKGNVSSRWHHISTDEHLCQACYEYYTCKDGLQPVRQWRRRWKSGGGKNQPSVKNFIAEVADSLHTFPLKVMQRRKHLEDHWFNNPKKQLLQVLPYWVQCRLCNKWRQVTSISPEVIQTFRCESSVAENGEVNQCTIVENPHLSTPVMVKNSPAGRFLANEYYCDLVGMSPTSRLDDWRTAYPMSEELEEVMQPFYLPNDYGRALSCRPDAMDSQELEEFPEYKSDQTLYLSVRNLVIALWSINPKEWVTPEKCSQFLICRGLVRILLVHETDRILRYLTVKGLVNFGILPSPPEFFTRTASKLSVLIIGAGISGLTAARHLQNLGAEVMILESKGEIGGRICDTHHMGTVVGKGGQLITGIVNNPFAVMCVQAGLKYRPLSDACPLFCSDGNLVDAYADKKVEFHFNSLLDAVEFYRSKAKVDSNLLGRIGMVYFWRQFTHFVEDLLMEIHDTYLEENGTKFNTTENELLSFHISNLEYSCGASLDKVSSLHWSQNEQFAQFAGRHALMTSGCSSIIDRLANGLNIKLKHRVTKIDYSGRRVKVSVEDGQMFYSDKVLVTVPLAVLQNNAIEFIPQIPERKAKSIAALGCGKLEKIRNCFHI